MKVKSISFGIIFFVLVGVCSNIFCVNKIDYSRLKRLSNASPGDFAFLGKRKALLSAKILSANRARNLVRAGKLIKTVNIKKRLSNATESDKIIEFKRVKGAIGFIWPLDLSSFRISSHYGNRKKPSGSWVFHWGIDMAAKGGTPIKAVTDGKVVQAGKHGGYGNMVLLSHGNSMKTRYAHMKKIYIYPGQRVKKGQVIGAVGATGNVWRKKGRDPSHLHFELYIFGKRVDPMKFLKMASC